MAATWQWSCQPKSTAQLSRGWVAKRALKSVAADTDTPMSLSCGVFTPYDYGPGFSPWWQSYKGWIWSKKWNLSMLCSGVWNPSNGQRQRSWFVWQRRWLEKTLKCTQSSAPGDAGLGCERQLLTTYLICPTCNTLAPYYRWQSNSHNEKRGARPLGIFLKIWLLSRIHSSLGYHLTNSLFSGFFHGQWK